MAQSGQPSTSLNRSLLFGISFSAGLALGILAVVAIHIFSPPNEQPTSDVAQHSVESPTSDSDASTVSKVGLGQFHEIFNYPRISEQYQVLHSTLSKATEQELKDWWIHSQEIERGSHRKIAQTAILQHLTKMNPQAALLLIEEVSKFDVDVLLKSVLAQWSISYLDGAVEAASKLSGVQRLVAAQTIVETRDDLSDTERRSIARQLDGEEQYLQSVSDTLASLSIADPNEAFDILHTDDVADSLQTESLSIVVEAWFEQIGFEVLSNIYKEFEDNRRDSNRVRSHLVRRVVQAHPAEALQYVRALPEGRKQTFLAKEIVSVWASTNPEAALTAAATFESISLASELETTISNSWAVANPSEYIDNFEKIPERSRGLSLPVAFMRIAHRTPSEAITKLEAVEKRITSVSAIEQLIVSAWTMQDPDATAGWVIKRFDLDDPQRFRLLRIVLPHLTQRDPNRAFELAIAEPTPNRGSRLENIVISTVVMDGDIELALELLPRAKDKDPFTYADVGVVLFRESRTEEALELGENFSGRDHQLYYERFFSEWFEADPKDLYESLDGLPSKNIRSSAASKLIVRNRANPIFTDEQIERIENFLNSEDEARLNR